MPFIQCPHCKKAVFQGATFSGQCPYCNGMISSLDGDYADFYYHRQRRSELVLPEDSVDAAGAKTVVQHGKRPLSPRVLISAILFVCAALLNIFSVEIHNFIAALAKDYGNHVFTTTVDRVMTGIEQVCFCAGSIMAFYFDDQKKKKGAIVSVLLALTGMWATQIINFLYHYAGETKEFFNFLAGGQPVQRLIGSLLITAFYAFMLGMFVMFNDRLKKFPLFLLWILLAILLYGNIHFLQVAACCVGFCKHLHLDDFRKLMERAGLIGSGTQQSNKREAGEDMEQNKEASSRNMRILKAAVFIGFAVFVLFSFETAANLIAEGGKEIGDISSVGGRTLEEAYYHELGFVYEGIALAVRTFGKVLAVVISYCGAKK